MGLLCRRGTAGVLLSVLRTFRNHIRNKVSMIAFHDSTREVTWVFLELWSRSGCQLPCSRAVVLRLLYKWQISPQSLSSISTIHCLFTSNQIKQNLDHIWKCDSQYPSPSFGFPSLWVKVPHQPHCPASLSEIVPIANYPELPPQYLLTTNPVTVSSEPFTLMFL